MIILKTRSRASNPNALLGSRSVVAGGFALIATISVMVLMVMVALAMTTLATMESRSSTQESAQKEAMANARLALMMAIGELQKHTGPDQRVTAEADILDSSGFAGWQASKDKQHYVGVYSTEEWHKRDNDGLRGSLKTYHPDRNKDAFQRWLTSGTPEQVEALDFVKSPIDQDGFVQVLGKGTTSDDPDNFVFVPTQELTDSNGGTTGRIGWWVGDQGVKARVNLSDSRKGAASDWDRRFALAAPATTGVVNIGGLENLDPATTATEELYRMMTQSQIPLVSSASVTQEVAKSLYYDVSTYSRAVLADVALGGLKRDLSLPFELPTLDAPTSGDWDYPLNQTDLVDQQDQDFNSIWEFSNSGDQNAEWSSIYWPASYRPHWWANKLGYCFLYPDPNGGTDATGKKRYLRGPTWQSLRNHYRSYKREYEKLSSGDVSRRGWMAPGDSRTWLAQPYQPYSHWHNSRGEHLLSTTYVGAKGGADTLLSPDLFDPFYRFGSHRGRPWNNLGHDTLGRSPIMTKVGLVLSHQSHPYGSGRRLELVMNAVGTVWNPYNVPIEFESIFANLDLKGMKWNFTRKRSNGTDIELAIDPQQISFGREKYFPFQHFRLGVTAESNPNYPFTSTRPSKLIRLNPGECRTFALNFNTPKPYIWGNMTAAPGSFANNWEGGMSLRFTNKWHVETGDKFKFELLPQENEKISLETYLGYFQQTNGGFANPFDANQQGTAFKDLPELSSLHIASAADILEGGTKVEKLLSNFTNDQEAICYIEFRMRASDSSPRGVLGEFDPRAIVNHSYSMGPGEKGSVPGNWDVTAATVSDFDLMQAGIGDRNNGFWGSSHEGNGETHVVAFEVPDAPLTNLAALQHCQTGSNGWDVSYAIGNSLPHPSVPQTALVEQISTDSAYKTTLYDMSYLTNQGLWDSYYFSGIQLGDDPSDSGDTAEAVMEQLLDSTLPNPLANKRLVLTGTPSGMTEDRRLKELTHYRWMARHLMLDGAANINSTRVEAWKAWLSSLNGADVDQVSETGNLSVSSGEKTPFVRSSVSGGAEGEQWRGYVRLSDADIENLAELIVEEVKKRGPFLSVADFVNRRLASDETGEMGVLQAALEKSGLDTGSDAEKGIPGTIKQGDILNSLGATITARSDTFVIRAYGESVSSNDPDRVLARAWCEAVVQRMPTLVSDSGQLLKKPNPAYPGNDPAGTDAYIDNDAITARQFGREYRIISFRWLNAEEV
ncbi:hypothetical protein NT6N_35830 [Oceaniferula spumae]|uniref:Verru_Chthon cassette protein A n=1 Tax=Oceaniferula spumae TaxID=2979115 RepID=A0AAT9FRE0_9BACT